MNIFRINTTAYEQEDFYLMTTLSEEQITKVIKPIVQKERDASDDYDEDNMYDNETLTQALVDAYPNHETFMYVDFDTITI